MLIMFKIYENKTLYSLLLDTIYGQTLRHYDVSWLICNHVTTHIGGILGPQSWTEPTLRKYLRTTILQELQQITVDD